MDALGFAKIHDFLLREQRVVFDLVGGGGDGSGREQLGEVLDGVVCYADGFYLKVYELATLQDDKERAFLGVGFTLSG